MSKPMNYIRKNVQTINLAFFSLTLSFLLLLSPEHAFAQKNGVIIGMDHGNARISFLKGKADLTRKGLAQTRRLKKNDLLLKGDMIQTGDNSRIEIQLPDKSYIRFEEKTQFILESASLDRKKKIRDVSIKMILGKVWAKASKLFSGRGRFAIATRTAVAGVRGTVYRMNVNEDNSAVVKVYYGEVLVSSKKKSKEQAGSPQAVQGPRQVSGPHPIPGPHAVSREEWTHIVRSMQQIMIKPDGTASRPFNFSPAADEDEWVQWNKQRDEKITGNDKE